MYELIAVVTVIVLLLILIWYGQIPVTLPDWVTVPSKSSLTMYQVGERERAIGSAELTTELIKRGWKLYANPDNRDCQDQIKVLYPNNTIEHYFMEYNDLIATDYGVNEPVWKNAQGQQFRGYKSPLELAMMLKNNA